MFFASIIWFVLSALVIIGFVKICKNSDKRSVFILIGILFCAPVLLYSWLMVGMALTSDYVGGTSPTILVWLFLLWSLALLVIVLIAVGIILRRIIKTIIKRLNKKDNPTNN